VLRVVFCHHYRAERTGWCYRRGTATETLGKTWQPAGSRWRIVGEKIGGTRIACGLPGDHNRSMQSSNEPAAQQDEPGRDEPAQHEIDERDAIIRELNEAMVRWLAEFDAMESAA
jgi:hypothetical protein